MEELSAKMIQIIMESPMYLQMPLKERFDLLMYLTERYAEHDRSRGYTIKGDGEKPLQALS